MSERVEGPKVTRSCHGCAWHDQERYQVQGDRGYNHYCTHAGTRRYVGEEATPLDWCPVPVRQPVSEAK